MVEEIKVKPYRTEDNNYNELWCTFDKPKKYYARHVYRGMRCWYYVCDPLGYCELDYSVPEDVIFIVCDGNGNECFKSSNGEYGANFPTLEEFCKQKWEEIRQNHLHTTENYERDFWSECWNGTTTQKLNQWLLSFKDPNLYKKEIDDMYGYDENWLYCRTDKVSMERLLVFNYIGSEIAIYKVTYRHRICGAEWCEYESRYTAEENEEYQTVICTHGVCFDSSKRGNMYSRREAEDIVVAGLKELYGGKSIGIFKWMEWGKYWQQYICDGYSHAAEVLLNGDYHSDYVDGIIEKERVRPMFRIMDREHKAEHDKEFPDWEMDMRMPNINGYRGWF